MEYRFTDIEKAAKEKWAKNNVYKVENNSTRPKYYVLDMFPYPSGAGLHVGHPLGYIASDIFARYKRLKGYNVLHPMGFDAFGLPAEQYALETGQHPAVTTEKNIARYKEQLDNIGFSYDWSREVRTSDPKYYKWTQWIFLQLFDSWYDRVEGKARPIRELISIFESNGNNKLQSNEIQSFTSNEWHAYSEKEKRAILMNYRLAYQDYAQVWWCEALGTVLANDEVVNGVSERGSHPVERKQMRQWFLRITEFADRLLSSLDNLDWSDSMKEMQRNWIGKSVGAEINFRLQGREEAIKVFTTRPDTIFGVDFMVLAPEHELVASITTADQKEEIENYVRYVKGRSERERISEVKSITGCFTGCYAKHPFADRLIPVWISEYVLAGYGTGAIMAVPSGDDRDHAFAKYFKIPITNIFGSLYNGEKAYSDKSGTIENSDFLSGMSIPDAAGKVIELIESQQIGTKKVNYRLRDAGFSRQRYWGEPFPIVYIDGIPYGTHEMDALKKSGLSDLPVVLPQVDHYKPGPEGQGPLANLHEWMNINDSGDSFKAARESNTMPGYAGSSWYFLRYMDPGNDNEFASRAATDYWRQVDLYVGGTEHAVGHLLYSRMWTKALYDLGHIGFDEPFKKLLNQGMIQGQSFFVDCFQAAELFADGAELFLAGFQLGKDIPREFEMNGRIFQKQLFPALFRMRNGQFFIDSKDRLTKSKFIELYIYNSADGENISKLIKNTIWTGLTENGEEYIQCKMEVEKMSKSKYNVVNPDDIVNQYGADTFRMYEMFLGPVEMSKPWDTKGIEGVHRFLKKFWRLYEDEQTGWVVNNDAPSPAELKVLHKCIKKISDDIEKFSFNTAVSQFMITVNELTDLGCHKQEILQPLVVLICPFAPHIAEELWGRLGNTDSVVKTDFPLFMEQYLIENTKRYPIAINGKPRAELEFALDADEAFVKSQVLADPTVQKWLEGKEPKKFIYVKGKMINVVI